MAAIDTSTSYPIGYTSAVINSSLVNTAPNAAYNPLIFGPSYVGPARWPRQGVFNVPPVLPSGALAASMAPAAYGGTDMPTATSESGNPFHPTKSPLWWGIGFLVAGLLMLMYIHYK